MKIANSDIISHVSLKLDTQDVFFVSDTHLGHANVIKFDGRPFSSVEEMNKAIIDNWNNKVSKNSTVFFLG